MRKVYIADSMGLDEELAAVAAADLTSALLWPWLLVSLDDWGRGSANPKVIRGKVLQLINVPDEAIDKAKTLLADNGLLILYKHNGRQLMAVPIDRWFQYQTQIPKSKRHNDESRFPAPDAQSSGNARDHAETRGDTRDDAQNCASPSPSLSPSLSNPSSSREDIDALIARHNPEDDGELQSKLEDTIALLRRNHREGANALDLNDIDHGLTQAGEQWRKGHKPGLNADGNISPKSLAAYIVEIVRKDRSNPKTQPLPPKRTDQPPEGYTPPRNVVQAPDGWTTEAHIAPRPP